MSRAFAGILLITTSFFAADAPPAVKTPVIFDTDMGNDCDDVLALALLHALQSRGLCDLRAVTLTNPDPRAGAFVAALNCFYLRNTIPVGVNSSAPEAPQPTRFLQIAEHYPHTFDVQNAPPALGLLRKTLASAEDGNVVIVQVGPFTNLAALLQSTGDVFSPLTGPALIRQKVRRLAVMAGDFSPLNPGTSTDPEFNVRLDVRAAQTVAQGWPTPVVWAGKELGEAIRFPSAVIENEFQYVSKHPVQEAYQLFSPTPHERPCYDLVPVLFALAPAMSPFEVSKKGQVLISDNGSTSFLPDADNGSSSGRHQFLLVTPAAAESARATFGRLVAEPPRLERRSMPATPSP